MTDTTDTGHEFEECLPNLRYVPSGAFGLGADAQKLQQCWRIMVRDNGGRLMGGRVEWRDVPYEPKPR